MRLGSVVASFPPLVVGVINTTGGMQVMSDRDLWEI